MSSADGGPSPGWYDDPERPGRPRWWDGQRWAAPLAAEGAGGPPGPPWAPGPAAANAAAAADLAQEHAQSGRARVAVWVGLVVFAVSGAVQAATFNALVPALRDALREAEQGRVATVPMDAINPGLSLASNLLLLASIAVAALFLVWFHRSITNARNLGLSLTVPPGWAVAGFLIPLVSLVLPFLSTRDLFPRDDPGRRLVAPWWVLWIVGRYGTSLAGLLGLLSPVAAGVALAGCVVALVGAAVYAVRIVGAAGAAHRALATRYGFVAETFDPAAAAVTAPSAAPDPWARAAGDGSGTGRPPG